MVAFASPTRNPIPSEERLHEIMQKMAEVFEWKTDRVHMIMHPDNPRKLLVAECAIKHKSPGFTLIVGFAPQDDGRYCRHVMLNIARSEVKFDSAGNQKPSLGDCFLRAMSRCSPYLGSVELYPSSDDRDKDAALTIQYGIGTDAIFDADLRSQDVCDRLN